MRYYFQIHVLIFSVTTVTTKKPVGKATKAPKSSQSPSKKTTTPATTDEDELDDNTNIPVDDLEAHISQQSSPLTNEQPPDDDVPPSSSTKKPSTRKPPSKEAPKKKPGKQPHTDQGKNFLLVCILNEIY